MVRNRIDQWSQVDNNMPVVKPFAYQTQMDIICFVVYASQGKLLL